MPICRWKRRPTTTMAAIGWAATCSPIRSSASIIETGKRIWHYQITHHDIWNYDLPSAPTLVNMTVDGRPVKALVQLTKQGFAYVLDRVTGQPVWPFEERPVPASDVPGERAWPTQPHPTKPPPYEYQGYDENDLIDFTPELRAEAIRIAKQYRLGPLFTPPSEIKPDGTKGTWYNPGGTGGSLWQCGGFDPETSLFYIPTKAGPGIASLRNDPKSNMRLSRGPGAQLAVQGLPILKPPYSRIVALDLNKGEYAWMVPLGNTPESVSRPCGAQGQDDPEHRRHRPAGHHARDQDLADRGRRLGRRARRARLRQENRRGAGRGEHSRHDGQHADDLHGRAASNTSLSQSARAQSPRSWSRLRWSGEGPKVAYKG